MNNLPSKEKYIMFLEPKYFKKHIFKTIYNKILNRLKNKGIPSIRGSGRGEQFVKTIVEVPRKLNNKQNLDY